MTTLPSPVQSVLELFQGPLSSVRFADIDGAGLAKLAAEVEAAASEVREQEVKLTELQQALAQRQEALLTLAQQALAYARVYAENDEALLDAVNRVTLPRSTKPRKAPASKANAGRSEAFSEASDATGDAAAGDAAASDAAASDGAAGAIGGVEAVADTNDGEDEKVASPPPAAPVRGTRKGRGAASQRAN